MQERLEELAKLKEAAEVPGPPPAIERHHQRGKLTARERIEHLLDDDSFQELDMLARHRAHGMGMDERRFYTDGVITGFGTIDGRKVCVFSQDATIFGGSLGEVHGEKIHKIMDLAASVGVPVVGLNDGGGARIQEGVVALAMYGEIFYRNVLCSGVIPQVSVILGASTGGAVYSPAMTDFIFMVQNTAQMAITGPDVVKSVTNEDVTLEELGGAMTHATKSGVAQFVSPDEKACLDEVRYLLSFLPSNNLDEPPYVVPADDPERRTPELIELMPPSANQAYGGAYVVMNSKSIGCDLAYAWPSAELAVMGPQGAVDVIYRREIAEAPNSEARRAELIEEYTERYANPYVAAERGYVDDVIDPADTRAVLIRGLAMLRSKREELPKRKHGNVPL